MTSKLAEAAQSNSMAIAAMQEGHNRQAVEILCDALDKLNFSRSSSPLIQCLAIEDSELKRKAVTESSPATTSVPIQESSRLHELLPRAIYNRAFVLPSGGLPLPQTSAVLRFNLALSIHREGIETGNTKCLSTALFLYYQAYSMIEGTLFCQSLGIVAILAAIYHNMQQLYGEFWQVSEARFLRTKLEHIFELHASIYLMCEEDFAFFHVNLFLSETEDFKLAPAA